jgi:putative ABC transport system permease protein
MFRLTVKNLWANKIRFAFTTFGVILAVSFVVSAFVLGDGLRSSFTTVSEDITAGTDLEVRNHAAFGDTPPLPTETVSAVRSVEGVSDAVPVIESAENSVRPVKADGSVISTNGPPQLAFNWIDNAELSAFTLVDGSPPSHGEFTIDVDAAAKHGFVIGHSYELMTPDGQVELTLSGTSSFGADNSTLGAVLMQMNTAQASELFGIDGINSVAVQLADDADLAEVQAAVAANVPTAEVVDHATVLAETTEDFTKEINLVGNVLLGFGGVALFVSVFIIYNTFGIVLSQRTRELALLRTVGADPKQIRRSVLAEAVLMGALASAGGIAGGILVAKGIDALFGLMGVDLSDYPLILAPRTWVAAIVVGMGVTVVAALGPARRAASVPPVVAMSTATEPGAGRARARLLGGVGLLAAGVVAAAVGLSAVGPTSVSVAALAAAAMCVFLGVAKLSSLVVRPVTGVAGWPLRTIAGVAGRLAQRNAARNARRTATTAAALMIGLTLVAAALVVGESVKATIGSTFEQSANADYYITDELDEVDFPASLAGEIRASQAVSSVTRFTHVEARVDGVVTDVRGVDFDEIDAAIDVDMREGGFLKTASDPMVVSTHQATDLGVDLGDKVTVELSNGARVDTTVVGLFDDQTVIGEDYMVDTTVLEHVGIPVTPEWLAVSIADHASQSEIDALVASVSDQFPYASIETEDQFRERITGEIDKVLTMVNVMVGLAVIIALIGIANTLALSVFERTRELGLLRAVGMSRRQLRRMVRLEAALIALFGSSVGVGLGLLFGAGLVGALPSSFAAGVSIPITQIGVVVAVATLAAVAAAWLPARRASRLDVLEAIAL